jgi:hypothetical protein
MRWLERCLTESSRGLRDYANVVAGLAARLED